MKHDAGIKEIGKCGSAGIIGSPSSKYEHRRASASLRNIRNMKPIVPVTYENERILIKPIKNSLPYIKCVLRLSCVTHGPIHGRFMGCTVNGFPLQILERAQREQIGSNNPLLNGHNSAGTPHRKEETQE